MTKTAMQRAQERITDESPVEILSPPTSGKTVRAPSRPTNQLVLDRTYKRDSKGRFGSGSGLGAHGPVRPGFMRAKSIGELEFQLRGRLKKATGRDIDVDLTGSDLQVAKEHAEGILRAVERFPDAPLAEVRVVGPPKGKPGEDRDGRQTQDTWDWLSMDGAMAATTEHLDGPRFGQRLLINRDYAGDPARYDAGLKESGKAGFLVAASPTGVAAHEMGHVLARGTRSATAAKRAVSAEAKRQGVKPSQLIRRTISHYAQASIHELTGEAFADVIVHGDGASAASRIVYDVMAARVPVRVAAPRTSAFYGRLRADRERRAQVVLDRQYRRDSKGRFGSGGGVRDSLANAGTAEEVSAVLAGEASAITGRKIRADLTGSDVQVAREHAEGVLQGFERYPRADIQQIITYGPGSAEGREDIFSEHSDAYAVAGIAPTDARSFSYAHTIAFNNAYAGNAERYRRSLDRDESEGHAVPGGPLSTALHEFGHHVVRQTRAKTAGKAAVTERAREGGEKPSVRVRREIGHYATTNNDELTGEAFADVMVHGADASVTSHAIMHEIDSRYARDYGEPGKGLYRPPSNVVPTFQALVRDVRGRVEVEARVFKRDRDGKFASGDGGERGIRDALAAPKTLGELETAAAGEFQRILGQRVGVKLQGLELEAARAHCEGVARGAEMFPHTDLISVTSYGPGGVRAQLEHPSQEVAWGITTSTPGRAGADIAFNTRIDAAKMRDVTRRATEGGLVHGDPHDISRTGSHEFGHAAAASLRRGEPQTAAVEALRVHGGADPYGHLFGAISRYAGGSPDELIGEAVAQVATRGPQASPLARDITARMQSHWEEWKI